MVLLFELCALRFKLSYHQGVAVSVDQAADELELEEPDNGSLQVPSKDTTTKARSSSGLGRKVRSHTHNLRQRSNRPATIRL